MNKFTRLYKINVLFGFITMSTTVVVAISEYSRINCIMNERNDFMIKEKNNDNK